MSETQKIISDLEHDIRELDFKINSYLRAGKEIAKTLEEYMKRKEYLVRYLEDMKWNDALETGKAFVGEDPRAKDPNYVMTEEGWEHKNIARADGFHRTEGEKRLAKAYGEW